MRQQSLDLAVERRQVGEIHQADSAAADLVLIGRADPAPGRADAGERVAGFADGVELLVQGQNERSVLSDTQRLRRHLDALTRKPLDFLK